MISVHQRWAVFFRNMKPHLYINNVSFCVCVEDKSYHLRCRVLLVCTGPAVFNEKRIEWCTHTDIQKMIWVNLHGCVLQSHRNTCRDTHRYVCICMCVCVSSSVTLFTPCLCLSVSQCVRDLQLVFFIINIQEICQRLVNLSVYLHALQVSRATSITTGITVV